MRDLIKAAMLLAFLGGAVVFIAEVLPGWLHSDERRVQHLLELGTPITVRALQVTTPRGDLVWAIENPLGRAVDVIDYGELPAGFVQTYPTPSAARALANKEVVVFSAAFASGRFVTIHSRFAGGGAFLHGLTVSGSGCDQPGCQEIFRLRLTSE